MHRSAGFTLIEVMIVMVIIAILAAIGYPAYGDYVMRGKIVEASSNLSDMRVRLEQYFQDNRTYVGACAAGTLAPLPSGENARYFTYACPTLTANAYSVTATGNASEGMAGFGYSIDQDNTRATVSLPSAWSGAGSACWVVKKSGSC
jgi:type IV pilus assembly protein PilE